MTRNQHSLTPHDGPSITPADIANAVAVLIEPIKNVEPIWRWDHYRHRRMASVYVSHHPSLLDQLAAAVVPGTSATHESSVRGIPHSIPPARLEAIDACLLIETAVAMWVTRLGLHPRPSLAENLRAFVSAATQLSEPVLRELYEDLCRWRWLAVSLTGWEEEPVTFQYPCPQCGERTVRCRLMYQTAWCGTCRAAWTPTTIGVLADHFRLCRHELSDAKTKNGQPA